MTTIEYTDTFSGEANYCWVKRWHHDRTLTDRAEVRLAKSLCGLTGHPCRTENWGDTIAIYPRGMARVVFVGYAEDAEHFGQPAFEDDLTETELRSAGLHPSQR